MNDHTNQLKARKWFAATLVLSAGTIGFLIVTDAAAQLGQGGGGSRSGMVSHAGGYTVMTSDAGNEDVVVVLDARNEQLLAYRVESAGAVQLQQKIGLPKLFNDAKAKAMGVK